MYKIDDVVTVKLTGTIDTLQKFEDGMRYSVKCGSYNFAVVKDEQIISDEIVCISCGRGFAKEYINHETCKDCTDHK